MISCRRSSMSTPRTTCCASRYVMRILMHGLCVCSTKSFGGQRPFVCSRSRSFGVHIVYSTKSSGLGHKLSSSASGLDQKSLPLVVFPRSGAAGVGSARRES
jgi:hypothetical protein